MNSANDKVDEDCSKKKTEEYTGDGEESEDDENVEGDPEGLEEVGIDEKTESPVKVVRDPGCPTAEELERHNMTHMPYRAWCPICVEAKGKEDPHRLNREGKGKGEIPTIGMDYKSLGESAVEEDKKTTIVVRDGRSRTTFSHVVQQKGMGDGWIVNKLIEDIETLGYTDIIIKTDGEPALMQVAKEIKARRRHPTIPNEPPAYDPQSNGAIEKAVGEVTGQVRALKIALESRIKEKVTVDMRIFNWIVEHACLIINRYQVGKDGKTPYRRITGKQCNQQIIEFGEQVMAKPMRKPQSNRKRALASRWIYGTWVGVTQRSGEHLVILAEGGGSHKSQNGEKKIAD